MLRTVAALSLCCALAAVAVAEEPAPRPYAIGDLVDPVVLQDQHGHEHLLGEDVRLVLFARDMDAGDLAAEALEDGGAELLEARHAVYVADIHRMPALVSRLFALPSLRRRGYPVWLDREGRETARLPAEPGKLTLLRLRGLRVTGIDYADSAAAVRAALEEGPGA